VAGAPYDLPNLYDCLNRQVLDIAIAEHFWDGLAGSVWQVSSLHPGHDGEALRNEPTNTTCCGLFMSPRNHFEVQGNTSSFI
jgi:hypothetical protein